MKFLQAMALIGLFLGTGCYDFGLDDHRFPCERNRDCLQYHVCLGGECRDENPARLISGITEIRSISLSKVVRDMTPSEAGAICDWAQLRMVMLMDEEARCAMTGLHGEEGCAFEQAMCLNEERPPADPTYLCDYVESFLGCEHASNMYRHSLRHLMECLEEVLAEEVYEFGRLQCEDPASHPSKVEDFATLGSCATLHQVCLDENYEETAP